MKNIAEEKQNWISSVRGRMTENAPLGTKGWFRCGGTADLLFKPEDFDDLVAFLRAFPCAPSSSLGSSLQSMDHTHKACDDDCSKGDVHVFGVMSNCIIRDGGLRGAVIRLGREFAGIEVLEDNCLRVGVMALDGNVAMAAAKAGVAGLEFYSGIPGTIGGALRMNAGCYGTETKDVLVEATAIDRMGCVRTLTPEDMGMAYRHTETPDDYIFTSAVLQGIEGDPETIKAHMKDIKERRSETQPIREQTGGSTFANPSAAELSQAGLSEDIKVWQLIDRAGCRGLMVGGAQMSELHCNFMINTGTATASDLENLGEEVRRRVFEDCGIRLRWEIKRMGSPRR